MEVSSYDINMRDGKYIWNSIVSIYLDRIKVVLNKIRPLYIQYLSAANLAISTYRLFGGIIMYHNEIDEIAKILEISFAECLLLQLTYEAFSACTSALVEVDHQMVHFRTMDWALPELKDITIRIKMYDGDRYLFEAISWAGFVGILTGIKPHKFTISLNYRRSKGGSLFDNLKMLITGAYPSSYFIRELLSNDVSLLANIKQVDLISPAYFIVMSDEFSGVIIRDRKGYRIKSAPIVQTNCDGLNDGDNILYSFERLRYMRLKYDSIEELIAHTNQFPVVNNDTIYKTIMTLNGFIHLKC